MKIMFRKTERFIWVLAAVSIVMLTFSPAQAKFTTSRVRAKVHVTTSDAVVLEWNEIATTTILPNGPPFTAARFMTITQLAVFEAVNSITHKYDPYLGTISAPVGASPEAAAATAAHRVLVVFVPAQAAALDQRWANSLAAIPDGQAKTDGIAVGEAAAEAMIVNRTNDGSAPPMVYLPITAAPYEWQITPGCTGGVFMHWPNVMPFGIESASQFRSKPPPPLKSLQYARDFIELRIFGDLNSPYRPQDRTDVAKLYAATPGHWLWNYALLQIARERHDDITDTARTAAVMNMAINDAYISVFDSKYFYKTWRPVTAIPRADEDGNRWTAAGAFTPLISTPCFPGYPSAHGSGSGAARTVLERAYGRFGHSVDVFHPGAPGIVINYTDLRDITDDVSDARVYGGIHFRFDQDAGAEMGDAVGRYIYNHSLRKLRHQ